jgi:hypothetical protein
LDAGVLQLSGTGGSLDLCVSWVVGFLVPLTEYWVAALLSSVGTVGFLVFKEEAGVLLLSGTLGSAGPFCALRKRVS